MVAAETGLKNTFFMQHHFKDLISICCLVKISPHTNTSTIPIKGSAFSSLTNKLGPGKSTTALFQQNINQVSRILQPHRVATPLSSPGAEGLQVFGDNLDDR